MILQKWNPKLKKYESYPIPFYCHCSAWENDMSTVVNCAQCMEEIPFGETYTSLEVHSSYGLGYGVCKTCYEQEWQRRKESKMAAVCGNCCMCSVPNKQLRKRALKEDKAATGLELIGYCYDLDIFVLQSDTPMMHHCMDLPEDRC